MVEKDSDTGHPGERGCTDVFWLCVYILFWFLMVLIAAFSFVYGNPIRIINGYDSFGNTCGTKNDKQYSLEFPGLDTTDKPYLLFFDVKALRQSLKVCVKQCPRKTIHTMDELYEYHESEGVGLCKYNFDYADLKNTSIANKNILSGPFGPCPSLPIYLSEPILNRCVPESLQHIAEGFYDLFNGWDTLEQVWGDLYHTWKHILCLSLLALGVSLLIVAVLHILAHIVSYIVMILFAVVSIAGTAYLWYVYLDIKHGLDMKETSRHFLLLESVRNETAFFWYSIVATVITTIVLLIVIAMRKRISFLADLFRETSKCMLHLPGLFFQPILTFVVLLAFLMFWLFVTLCLATAYYPGTNTMNSPFTNDTSASFTTPVQTVGPVQENSILVSERKMTVVEFVDPIWVKYMWWVYIIGLIWTCEFIMACQQMVIAGSVAHWFYRHKYKDNAHISYALCKLIKYHLGSVAVGALLITLFKIPRLVLMIIHEKLRRMSELGNQTAAKLLKGCICCIYLLENFLRYLNHNAYTVIAIDGVGFCSAAGTAFQVLSTHGVEVAIINSVGDFILFLGKCLVTAIVGTIGLFLFRNNTALTFYAAPTLVVCIFAFFIAHCILSLYEMVLDTIYLCICQNDGAPEEIHMEKLGMQRPAAGDASNANNPNESEPLK